MHFLKMSQIVGQSAAVAVLTRFAAKPASRAFLFHGPTGVGKTSAATALADLLGVDVAKGEFGGLYSIPAGEQSAQAVRDMMRLIVNLPFHGSGCARLGGQ